MPNYINLDPIIEKMMLSKGFKRAPVYWTHEANQPIDATGASWSIFRRITDGDKLIPYELHVHFVFNKKGQPYKAYFRAKPQQTANRYASVKLVGRNKILVHFDQAVDMLTKLQDIYCNQEGREKRIKPQADAIYSEHAT